MEPEAPATARAMHSRLEVSARDQRRGPPARPGDNDLPSEPADRFTKPFARFLRIEAATGVLLAASAGAALLLSNSRWSRPFLSFWETSVGLHFGPYDFSRSLQHWINDGAMTLFFFVVALELKRALVRGELRSLRMAAFSLAGALGGMLVPASIYLALMHDEPGMEGWGTVMATDTAFVMGGLALLGSRIPTDLRLFLLALAIFDDVGAILVIALVYGDALSWPALAVVLALVAAVFAAARAGIRSVPVYFLLGVGMWLAFDASGIHATVTGIVLGLMTPTREWVSDERLHTIFERVLPFPGSDRSRPTTRDRAHLRRAGIAAKEAFSPVERLEMMMHPWSAFVIMPVFALANAGTRLHWADLRDPIAVAVFAGLVIGKPSGVVALSWLAVRARIATRPQDLSWSLVGAGALLTGIGFTMSLFIAGLAFAPAALGAAKLGILGASIVSGAAGLLTLSWLTAARRNTHGGRTEGGVLARSASAR